MGLTQQKLTFINVSIAVYFLLLWTIDLFHIKYTIIGVLRELFTIPALLAQIVFLVIGIEFLIKKKQALFL